MTEYYIWLQQLMGVANPRSLHLISYFGDVKTIYKEVQNGNVKFLKENELQQLKNASIDYSKKIIEFCEKNNYKIIKYDDVDYPFLLQSIYNPPLLLFVEGDISTLNNELCVTVIGTRNPSEYSLKVAEVISSKLAKTGIVIVSGFALGIDKTAQTAAYDAGGKTIGVLACGIDVDYPRGSTAFRKKIAASGGAAISELLPGQKTDKRYFHQRNRIMSGLSQGTLLVEAASSSGCHITANYTINQNRDLFCIPPSNIFMERYSGVTPYLRDGAIPVFSYIDILNQYKSELEIKLNDIKFPEYTFEENEKTEKHKIKPISKVMPEKPPTRDYSSLPPEQKVLYEFLKEDAQNMDYLKMNSGFELNELSDILLDMELDGLVESLPGARYKLK